MFRKFLLPTLLLGAAASPALALDFGDSFFVTGEVELEYFGSDGDFDSLGYASVDLGYEQPGGGFGAFIGLDSFVADGGDDTGYYGAVSYSGAFGKVQIGAPRAAYDDYLETPIVGGIRIYDVEIGFSKNSIVTTASLFFDTETQVGIRYDGTFGPASFGVSYHEIEDAKILDVAGNYTLGTVVLRAGFETVEGESSDRTSYSLGAEGSFGPVMVGILHYQGEIEGEVTGTHLYAVYSPMDKLDVTASVLALDFGSSDTTLYGLSADYTFYQDVFVQAGLITNDGETAYDLSLGVKF